MRTPLSVALAVSLALTPASYGDWLSSIRAPYVAEHVDPIRTANSPRLAALMRGGNIYLSLRDMVALAIENNIDVESQRYGAQIAEADLLRARSGAAARGISTSISQGPSSSGSGVLAGSNLLGSSSSGNSGAASSGNSSGGGTSTLQLDPQINFNSSWGHTTSPLTSRLVTGTSSNSLVTVQKQANLTIGKGFLTGTSVTYGYYNTNVAQNSPNNDFNPSTSGTFVLDLRQHLLQGFGRAVNGRNITIAKNDRELNDLVFKQQVIVTASNAINQYWDLAALRESVKVRQEALRISQRLLEDNRTRVAIGALASIEIVRAEAEVARDQQDLTNSETQVLEQETVIKDFLTRSDVDDLAIIGAHIVPTDPMAEPRALGVEPIQDLMAMALSGRPEIKQSAISLVNTKEGMRGTKNALLPQLDVVADLENHGLSGQVNTLLVPDANGNLAPRSPASVDPYFVGGYSRVLAQLFGRNFPDYTVGVQLNIPLRNRAARADFIRDELTLRQQQLSDLKLRKQIKTEVQNAVIAYRQAKSAYDTAVKSRQLEEKTLEAERKKFEYGASTILNVILVQRDLTTAQSFEVTALNAYAKAKVQLDQSLGQTLDANDILIGEAAQGRISRGPSAIPNN